MADVFLPEAPLVQSERNMALPPTWCVVSCEQGCRETWTVDAAEFSPQLTVQDVEELLTPLLLAHEVEHGRW
ncbi:MAG TPA: hypothetical protein VFJ19_09470 [Nocardioidaceae bacterium]|nr:hypothetical protein [Nocardioidaceae bacterium]